MVRTWAVEPSPPLKDPWLLAVWPGMGGVAISAGYYLMAKLGMHLVLEFPATDYFDRDEVYVKRGLIVARRLPRSRMFAWRDPNGGNDLLVFIGEAQPQLRAGEFCSRLIASARELNVSKVHTFAAMATQMRPAERSRVFGAAIDKATLEKFQRAGVEPLETATISGLNGTLLETAAAHGLTGGCLLGEIPHVFSQIPFPKASMAVLEVFSRLSGVSVDLGELKSQADRVDRTLEDFLLRMEGDTPQGPPAGDDDEEAAPSRRDPAALERLEALFEEAGRDRARAFELKQELDRLGLFEEYEDRFLDLFKEP